MLLYTEKLSNKGIMGIMERTCNHIDQRLLNHGLKVSYLVSKLLPELGILDRKLQRDICFIALLHDIGAYKTEEIDKMLQFETVDVSAHTAYGYLFIRNFSPLKDMAEIVLLHHTSWKVLENLKSFDSFTKQIAQVISIADRIEVMAEQSGLSFLQVEQYIKKAEGRLFAPDIVKHISVLEGMFPLDIDTIKQDEYFNMICEAPFTEEEITEYLKMITYVIDFRSPHTVTHTITTTSISYELSLLMNLDEKTVSQIVCAALLHDLGKIAIPVEILESPGKLSHEDMIIMKTHVELAEEILGDDIDEVVKKIALRHHEKLDGSGYPKGIRGEELSTAERILAVADIVSALAGARSYKGSFDKERIISIIKNMSQKSLIDPFLVTIMVDKFDYIMEETAVRCDPLLRIYDEMQGEFELLKEKFNV